MIVHAGVNSTRVGIRALRVVRTPSGIECVVAHICNTFVNCRWVGIIAFGVVFTTNVDIDFGKRTSVCRSVAGVYGAWVGVNTLGRTGATTGFWSVTALVVDARIVGAWVAVVTLRRCRAA